MVIPAGSWVRVWSPGRRYAITTRLASPCFDAPGFMQHVRLFNGRHTWSDIGWVLAYVPRPAIEAYLKKNGKRTLYGGHIVTSPHLEGTKDHGQESR